MVTNMKAAKKLKGFMCHTPASTAVCMAQDYRSVIVPRRPDTSLLSREPRLINGPKYIQLGKKQAISTTVRSYPVSSVKKDIENEPQQVIESLASSDQVFQVVVMRVSLHCQACAGKVKKHLSKMEGIQMGEEEFSVELSLKNKTAASCNWMLLDSSGRGITMDLDKFSIVKRASMAAQADERLTGIYSHPLASNRI